MWSSFDGRKTNGGPLKGKRQLLFNNDYGLLIYDYCFTESYRRSHAVNKIIIFGGFWIRFGLWNTLYLRGIAVVSGV